MYMNIRPSLGKSIFPYSRDSELKRLDHNRFAERIYSQGPEPRKPL